MFPEPTKRKKKQGEIINVCGPEDVRGRRQGSAVVLIQPSLESVAERRLRDRDPWRRDEYVQSSSYDGFFCPSYLKFFFSFTVLVVHLVVLWLMHEPLRVHLMLRHVVRMQGTPMMPQTEFHLNHNPFTVSFNLGCKKKKTDVIKFRLKSIDERGNRRTNDARGHLACTQPPNNDYTLWLNQRATSTVHGCLFVSFVFNTGKLY